MATNRKQRRDFFKKNKDKKLSGLSWDEFNKGVPKTKPIINKEKNI